MRFVVVSSPLEMRTYLSAPPRRGTTEGGEFVLVKSRWDDYGFRTTFSLFHWRQPGDAEEIGTVKVADPHLDARFGSSVASVSLPESFEQLSDEFYSVGQEHTYYERLVQRVGLEGAREALRRLNDIVLRPELIDACAAQRIGYKSIFRSVSPQTVRDQYARIVSGGRGQDPFTLDYVPDPSAPQSRVTFVVEPDEVIPGTLQVVIGSNGSGKTRLLQQIRSSFDSPPAPTDDRVRLSDGKQFAGVVTVGFSAFDVLARAETSRHPAPDTTADDDFEDRRTGVRDIGIELISDARTVAAQNDAFRSLVTACATAGRESRLLDAVGILQRTDRILAAAELDDVDELIAYDFGSQSSGHKIALLTLAALVASCDDLTLVLVDEPESHLHPPLLAAFVRAVATLVERTNSLAIIATHSPVVLQQVPSKHAVRITRQGDSAQFHELGLQTFGENLGTLTAEVFRVELEHAGHYSLLEQAAEKGSMEAALQWLGLESIGREAGLVLSSLIRSSGE